MPAFDPDEASRFKDAWLRTAADCDQFRKRVREREQAARATVQQVMDALRALSNGPSQLGDLADELQSVVDKLTGR